MQNISRRSFLVGLGLCAAMPGLLAACGSPTAAASEARSSRPRQSPTAPPEDLASLSESINAFAFELYRQVRKPEANFVFSPYSINAALLMALVGARSATAQQMSQTMRLSLAAEKLHAANNSLEQGLLARGQGDDGFKLNLANTLWGQTGYQFQTPYLDTLAEYYGAGMNLLDFAKQPEQGRVAINNAIAKQTQDKIKDLLPQGSIDPLTRLVITNAIYLKAKWQTPFAKEVTQSGDFTTLAGTTVSAQMMNQKSFVPYGEGEGYQIARLPYRGDASMVVLLPAAGRFAELDTSLDAARLTQLMNATEQKEVQVTLPKFDLKPEGFSLKQALTSLGMTEAFELGK
ncbi:MAG: serpin family protein, partial [Chloroflexaceae bacterium]|nr:serpin family protein [Chloroflexaceae bacterium]